jgi:hypothetical protein
MRRRWEEFRGAGVVFTTSRGWPAGPACRTAISIDRPSTRITR